ncbi:MAG: hypothetical protein WBE75_00205 [Candidatus Omnitrophota bacterium]
MIEINLLPQELRRARYGREEKLIMILSWRSLAALSAVLIAGMFFLNILLAFACISKKAQAVTLERKWEQMLPALKAFEQKRKIQESFSRDNNTVAVLSAAGMNWSLKISKLSELLPAGIWFNALTCSDKGLLLEAAVFSPGGGELELLNRFISDLKADADFSKDLEDIELGAVSRETAGGYEIMNFLVNAVSKRTTRK